MKVCAISFLLFVSLSDTAAAQVNQLCATAAASPTTFPTAGGTGTITVTAARDCQWTTLHTPPWLLPYWAMGAGSATYAFTVLPNSGEERWVTLQIGASLITIVQAANGCSVTAEAAPTQFGPDGGKGIIKVQGLWPTCQWTVTGLPTWVHVAVLSGISSPQSFEFSVTANTGPARSETMTIGMSRITIFQDAGSPTVTGLGFVPITPCRVLDTRPWEGKTGAFGPPALAADETRSVNVAASGCGVPSNAQAVSLNVTVAPTVSLGYLTVWPGGQPKPYVSTVNAMQGQVVANAAIVPTGTNGSINLYASDSTHVIVDVDGYFTSQAISNVFFYPLWSCRVVDTRAGQGPTGSFGPPSLVGNVSRSFALPAGRCALPSNARAYSLHFTVIPKGPLGYLTAWPSGQSRPLASTLNSFDGRIVANAAIVPAGPSGSIDILASDAADLVIDVNGYFAIDDGGGYPFHPVTPCRAADTRNTGIYAGGTPAQFNLAQSSCGLPTNAAAWALNVTAVPPGPVPYLTVWPYGTPQPFTSMLNSNEGWVVANSAVVPAGADGSICVYSPTATNLVIDVTGYFHR